MAVKRSGTGKVALLLCEERPHPSNAQARVGHGTRIIAQRQRGFATAFLEQRLNKIAANDRVVRMCRQRTLEERYRAGKLAAVGLDRSGKSGQHGISGMVGNCLRGQHCRPVELPAARSTSDLLHDLRRGFVSHEQRKKALTLVPK